VAARLAATTFTSLSSCVASLWPTEWDLPLAAGAATGFIALNSRWFA
jgi:hypothetical protein